MGRERSISPESSPTGSRGNSCSKGHHTCFERVGLHIPKAIIDDVIADKLDVELLRSLNPFTIADLSCPVGSTRFQVVKNIMEAVELKYLLHGLGSYLPEFQIVPTELEDETCLAWNKGRIHYTSSQREVVEAYSVQYAKDMDSFLHARAQEIVCGGLMALLIPSLPDETNPSQSRLIELFELLESSLKDMINMGFSSEAEVDSFNVPVYQPSTQELEGLIERNGCFSIERLETLDRSMDHIIDIEKCINLQIRPILEELIRRHFGSEIIDTLFDQFDKRVAEPSSIPSDLSCKTIGELFILLKRNSYQSEDS
ncbi:loganic acid O-methyltransferase-like isoform X2 [Macadamia integrifolia]|uniref:loganic acid O-methyltransferase-like isoform X2 n=1 Tax=Macadamia integrifolia TaxID=60698 RepID=UPI001C4FC3B3|nr:loganic acid O-methyltransferase-like isoform X2 [Macadamia integrifolia]